MKTIVYISLLLLTGYASTAEAYDWPPDINLKAIYFNYTSGDTSDGIALKHHHTSEIYPPEWTVSSSDTVAYVKSRQVNLKATIECNEGDITTIDVYPSDPGPTRLGTFQETAFGFAAADTATVVINRSSGNVPTSVGDKTTWMVWYVSSINGTPVTDHQIAYTNNNYYVVYDTPQAPMDKPWARVLDYACEWAIWETTAVGCATEVAEGIYGDLGDLDGDIDYGSRGSDYSTYDPPNDSIQHIFELDLFLNDLKTESNVDVYCHDTANLFSIFAGSLGLSSKVKAHCYLENGDRIDFDVTWVDIIGDDDPDGTPSFTLHQYACYPDTTIIYDPLLRFNRDTPFVPVAMPSETYIDSLAHPDNYPGIYDCDVATTIIYEE